MQKASGLESNCILSLEELEEAQTRRQRQVTRTFHCIQTDKGNKRKNCQYISCHLDFYKKIVKKCLPFSRIFDQET